MATVLVVDDDPDIRLILRLMLKYKGHDVLEADNGVDALHILQHAVHPLVVLLDLQMPVLSGAGVLGAVAADTHLADQHRYILMTADSRNPPLFFATLLTRLRVPTLRKPFDVERLEVLVAEVARTLSAR
jgi:CheY-like chemotaxis protein